MTSLGRAISLTVCSITLVIGCYRVSEYTGDGRLIDNGPFAATDRYVLTLGSVDLSRKVTESYRLVNLPETQFVAGIEIDFEPEQGSIVEHEAMNTTISLELTQAEGDIVFAKQSRLDKWTWSTPVNEAKAFIYGRGESATFFKPSSQSEYLLTLTVLEPEDVEYKYTARLVAKSGGWK